MGNEVAVRQNDAIARPESFEGLMQMADTLVKSGFLPSAIKTAAQAAAIMVAGREIGLSGMQSFRELYVVNGQVGMSTRLIVSFFKSYGGRYLFLERTPQTCTVRLIGPLGDEHDHTMTRQEADQMGITKEKNKETNQLQEKFNWRANPAGMLSNNTIKAAIRLWFPDCLLAALGPMQMPDADTVDAQVVEATVVEESSNGDSHAGPTWSDGVIITSKDGTVKQHWYLFREYQTRLWKWAETQTLTPQEICNILGVKATDDIAKLDLTPQGIVDVINETIATMGKPEAQNAELPF